MNAEVNYISRIVQTTNFFFETNEEGTGGGSTKIIDLIKPHASIGNVELRNFLLNDLFRKRSFTLTEAASELTSWLNLRGIPLPAVEDLDGKVRLACQPFERPPRNVITPIEILDRAFIRLARYIRLMQTTDVSRHSRVFDYFIPPNAILRGRSRKAPLINFHPEHVVPCAYIRDLCLKVFDGASIYDGVTVVDASIEDIVPTIRRLLAVVRISQDERECIDKGPKALKDSMPKNWDSKAGCIYERLHEKNIVFELLLTSDTTLACAACEDNHQLL